MLQYRTINKSTLEILKKIMQNPELNQFFLVGGTALALQLGHRISVDIDLFTNTDFYSSDIIEHLKKDFNIQIIETKEKNTLNLNVKTIDNSYVKVDFIKYSYPLINKIQEIDGIRLLSLEDIIAMKLSALANRGAKKDFYDIYEVLKTFSIFQIIEFFNKKYQDIETFYLIKSLSYFEDAEIELDPISLNNTDWKSVKENILKIVKVYFQKQYKNNFQL